MYREGHRKQDLHLDIHISIDIHMHMAINVDVDMHSRMTIPKFTTSNSQQASKAAYDRAL